MKLVIDNVAALPVLNLGNIAEMARKFADAVEAGEFASLTTATIVLDDGNSFHWGDCPTAYEAIGILDTAKHAMIRDLLDD